MLRFYSFLIVILFLIYDLSHIVFSLINSIIELFCSSDNLNFSSVLNISGSENVVLHMDKEIINANKITGVNENSVAAFSTPSTSNITSNNFLPDRQGMDELGMKILNTFLDFLRPVLEPVTVSYSNE